MPDKTSKDFVWHFHHLEGGAMGEKRKTLFKLLRMKNLFANEEMLNRAINNLHPKTPLENLFYVDTLIYFKRIPELLEILKQGNEVLISKILKQPWFFKTAFQHVEAKELVNELLPCLSFAMRMKVMKRFSVNLNEDKIDALFGCVLERYGLRIALDILHACSSTKIKEVLSSNQVTLQPKQVKCLFDKNLETFNVYLDYYKKNTGELYCNRNVFKHIASKNPKILVELKENIRGSYYRLGRRTSKKIVDLIKVDVANDPENYSAILNHSIIVRKCCFKNIYFDLFPREMDAIKSNHISNILLNHYPKKRQWDLFVETFSRAFQDKNISDNLDKLKIKFDCKLLINWPEPIIHKWAEIHYNKNNDIFFLKYFEAKKAIAIIKERINVTSNLSDRFHLLEKMVQCCSQNKDMNSLDKVLKYFNIRHRNEPVHIREQFLESITDNFEIENFTEAHWKYIKEQIDVLKIETKHKHWSLLDLIKKYIEFLFKNKKPFKEELMELIDLMLEGDFDRSFLLQCKNVLIQQQIFIQVLNVLPDRLRMKDKNIDSIYQELISDIVKFSVQNKEYFINFLDFPYLVNYISSKLIENEDIKDCPVYYYDLVSEVVHYNSEFPKNCVIENTKLLEIILADSTNSNDFKFRNLIESMVKKKCRSEFENQMLQCYFDKILDKNPSHEVNFWFIKNEPLTVSPYIDKIITKCLHPDFLHEIRTNNLVGIKYTNFNAQLFKIFKNELDHSNLTDSNTIMDYLFLIASTNDLINVIEKFLPEKEKFDLEDEKMVSIYETQSHIAKSIKNVADPLKMLPVVIKFSVGDYLKSALPSLYSIFYRTPEKQLYANTDLLSKRAVSVKKHAMFLSCELLQTNYAISMLKTAKTNDVSSKKHRFSATRKYFVKNPSEELLDLLITYMHDIDKNDEELLKKLSSIFDIPKKYRAVYIEKCWQFFEDKRKEGVKISVYLNDLIQAILDAPRDEILLLLTPKSCRNVIASHLMQDEDSPCNIEIFASNILRYIKSEQTENFNLVFHILSTCKHNNDIEKIKTFFKYFYKVASSKELDSNFLKLFSEYWSSLFTPTEMFHEFVLLNLLILRCDSPKPFLENYAKNVVIFLERLVVEYDLYIYNRFKIALVASLASNIEKEDKFLFFYEILKYKATKLNCILILEIMDVHNCRSEKIIKIYKDIVEILKNVDESVVKIYYNCNISSDIIHQEQ